MNTEPSNAHPPEATTDSSKPAEKASQKTPSPDIIRRAAIEKIAEMIIKKSSRSGKS